MKLNLSIEIFEEASRPLATGGVESGILKSPISYAVLQMLNRSRSFTEAKKNAALIEKIKSVEKDGQDVVAEKDLIIDVTDIEFAIICNSIQHLNSVSKAEFAKMVEKLNPSFSFETAEGQAA